MPTKHVIAFKETASPLTSTSTKFGGQPNWVSEPQWPLSEETGNPMRFIGQIALAEVPGFATEAQVAYIFMTDEEDGEHVDGIWDPDSGENAVVLQPGDCDVDFEELAEGPTLFRLVQKEGQSRVSQEFCEFAVSLTPTEDVEYMSEGDRWKLPDVKQKAARGVLEESKIGGTPVFLQGDELPFEEGWQLLLQLDSGTAPFRVNFGDVGIGYAFMNSDGTEAKFLWQCG
ncbi:MAG: DUF1963 domain-containing protein [Planctomycetota bacterium]